MSDWKPGDVAMVVNAANEEKIARFTGTRGEIGDPHWSFSDGSTLLAREVTKARPVVVIDPVAITGPEETGYDGDPVIEIANCLRRLAEGDHPESYRRRVAERLAEVFNPTTNEPTDVAARVTDRRDNIWRLLADGDWVCTSGPDIGEYLTWDRLAAERGPLEVEAS